MLLASMLYAVWIFYIIDVINLNKILLKGFSYFIVESLIQVLPQMSTIPEASNRQLDFRNNINRYFVRHFRLLINDGKLIL